MDNMMILTCITSPLTRMPCRALCKDQQWQGRRSLEPGGKVLLLPLAGKLPRLQLIWADSGYAGSPFKQWVKEYLGVRLDIVNHPWTGIRAVWVKEGEEVDWDKIIPKGFHILPRRWVIERTNTWITHNCRLARDFEGTHTSSEAFIYLAMSRLMVSRLARARP